MKPFYSNCGDGGPAAGGKPQWNAREIWRGDIDAILAIGAELDDPSPTAHEMDSLLVKPGIKCLVVESELLDQTNKLAGFVIIRNLPQHIQFHSLAVRSAVRRMGVGRTLVSWVLRDLSASRRKRASAYVRESDLDGQLFFRSCGFRAKVPIVKSYFPDADGTTFEDAYLFQITLKDEAAL